MSLPYYQIQPTQHFLLDSSAGDGGGAGGAGGAGVNMLYAGLKFTGLALNVAGGLAKAVRQDAERMMKELEADAAAKVGHNFTSLITVRSKVLSQWSNSVMLPCHYIVADKANLCILAVWSYVSSDILA